MKSFLIRFIALLLCIEVISAGIYLGFKGKAEVPQILHFYSSHDSDSPGHPCNKMKTNVLLYLSHDTEGKCTPKSGLIINDDYVVYDVNDTFRKTILTLGGSLTDGFYQHISNGDTWPKLLADLAGESYTVLNGGVASYSSLQELYKFVQDGPRIKNLKYVISVNGYNDIPGYHGDDVKNGKFHPFLHYIQYKINLEQKWLDQRYQINVYSFFPNTVKLFEYILRKYLAAFNADKYTSSNSVFSYIDAADRWQQNVERLNALVLQQNAVYVLFLQPTMGLSGTQSSPARGTKDYELFAEMSEEVRNEINSFYTELKSRCSKLDFCHDLSEISPPIGNNYYSFNHTNEHGNALIAKEIWTVINSHRKFK
jgi:lysophospholipase L1-like esterase